MKIFIIFGPPGAGKGTQAKLLAKNINLIHLSTGDLLRNEIKNKTEIGLQVEKLLSEGHYAPDEMMTQIIKNFLETHKDKDILLDGFPRTLPQVEELFKIQKDLEVIHLVTNEEELEKRLLLRAKLQGRNDDTPEIIKERFRVYEHQTKPVLDFLRTKDIKWLDINGLGEIEEIQKEILQKV